MSIFPEWLPASTSRSVWFVPPYRMCVPPGLDPAPRSVIVLSVIVTAVVQVQSPAGTWTTSPSLAESTAACTLPLAQLDAVMVAPGGGTAPGPLRSGAATVAMSGVATVAMSGAGGQLPQSAGQLEQVSRMPQRPSPQRERCSSSWTCSSRCVDPPQPATRTMMRSRPALLAARRYVSMNGLPCLSLSMSQDGAPPGRSADSPYMGPM